MSSSQALGIGRSLSGRRPFWQLWRGSLQGSDYTWAIAFTVPYIALFLAFVAYPVAYGLWLGHEPGLYVELFDDPIRMRGTKTA